MTNPNARLALVDLTYLIFLFVAMTKFTANLFFKNRYYFVDLCAAHIVGLIGESFKMNTSYIGRLMSLKCGK